MPNTPEIQFVLDYLQSEHDVTFSILESCPQTPEQLKYKAERIIENYFPECPSCCRFYNRKKEVKP